MKQIFSTIFMSLIVFSSAHAAVGNYYGEISDATGKLYSAAWETCELNVYEQTADHVIFAVTLNKPGASASQIIRASRNGREGVLENLRADYAFHSAETPVVYDIPNGIPSPLAKYQSLDHSLKIDDVAKTISYRLKVFITDHEFNNADFHLSCKTKLVEAN